MRLDRVKVIATMARKDMRAAELCQRAHISRASVTALRGGKSCSANTAARVAEALGVEVSDLLPDDCSDRKGV